MVKGKHRIYFLVAFPSAFLVGALVVFGASFLAATFLTSAVLAATFGVSFFSAVLAATLGVAVLAVSALVALAFSK